MPNNGDIEIQEEIIIEDDLILTDEQFNSLIDTLNDSENLEAIKEGIDALNSSETIDYSVHLNEIIDNQTLIIENQNAIIEYLNQFNNFLELFGSACSSIVTYSVYIVPLMLIVMMLWWLFKQFIR